MFVKSHLRPLGFISMTNAVQTRIENLVQNRDANPRDNSANHKLMNALALTGQFEALESASFVYRKALGPKNAPLAINTLASVGQHSIAIKFGTRRLGRDFNPKIAAALAKVALNAGDTKQASSLLDTYTRRVEKLPPIIRYYLARRELQQGNPKGAQARLKSYLEVCPRDPSGAFTLSLLSLLTGSLDLAELYAMRNAWLNKDRPPDVFHLMRVQQARNKPVQANSKKLELLGAYHWHHDSSRLNAPYSVLFQSVLPHSAAAIDVQSHHEIVEPEALIKTEIKLVDDVIKTGLSTLAFGSTPAHKQHAPIDHDIDLMKERLGAAQITLTQLAPLLVFTEQTALDSPYQSLQQRAVMLDTIAGLLRPQKAQKSWSVRLVQSLRRGQAARTEARLARLCHALSISSDFL